MLRHKLLRISSKDRDLLTDSTSDFTVSINNTPELQKIKSVIIKQVSIPYTFYNVTTYNNTFSYSIGGVTSSFTIPIGQYDNTSLMAAMIAAGTAVTLDITQSSTTYLFTITTTTPIQYLDITSNPMAEVLGILYGQGSVEDVLTFTASGFPDLSGHSNVYIESRALGHSNLIRTNGHIISTLAIIPITVPFGFIEQYTTPHSDIDDVDSDTIGGSSSQKIDIKLVDTNGGTLDLHGHHISIIVKLYY